MLHLHKLLWSQLQMFFFEVKIAFIGNRHKVNMSMRHLKANDGDSDTFTGHRLFNRLGDFLGKDHHCAQFLILDVENVIRLMFRHHEGMTFLERIDIEERKETVVLSDFVTRDLTLYDS